MKCWGWRMGWQKMLPYVLSLCSTKELNWTFRKQLCGTAATLTAVKHTPTFLMLEHSHLLLPMQGKYFAGVAKKLAAK